MDFYDHLRDWLVDQALEENPFEDTLKAFASRLLDGGVPIARMSIGRMMLHPAIGLYDMEWEIGTGLVTTSIFDRDQVTPTLGLHTPFGDIATRKSESVIADLGQEDQRNTYPLFADLFERGYTGYAAFGRAFGQKQTVFKGVHEDFRGTSMSFATKRPGGFTVEQQDGLRSLVSPIAMCLRVATERFLTQELLSHYLGRVTGERVYFGQSARGEGELIDCVLFFSDMRNSLDLAGRLTPDAYLATVNRFFDCTAGAVLEHGGEVLKFMGDAVLAIFPVIEGRRPPSNMARAAVSAARDAFLRAEQENEAAADMPELSFGIALHVGQVIYGNVGTAKRLDFTATGPAVGIAVRIESLTKELDCPLLATADFARLVAEDGTTVGSHTLRGFQNPIDLVAYDPAARD